MLNDIDRSIEILNKTIDTNDSIIKQTKSINASSSERDDVCKDSNCSFKLLFKEKIDEIDTTLIEFI